MKTWVEFAGFYSKWAIFVDVQQTKYRQVWKATVGVSGRGAHHLVSGHGELLELRMKLWVAPRGAGNLGLCCGLPAAKKAHTCDSNYDLHKDLSLCKSQGGWREMSPFPLWLMSDDVVMCAGSVVSHGWRGVVHWLLRLALAVWRSPTNSTLSSTLDKRVNVTIGKSQKIRDMTSEKCLVSHQDGGFYDWVLDNQALL